MLIIEYVKNEKAARYEFNDTEIEAANAFFTKIKNADGVTKLVCKTYANNRLEIRYEMVFAIKVVFPTSNKEYTYGSKEKVNPLDYVLVPTKEGLKIVQVKEALKTEKKKLPQYTGGRTPVWVIGKIDKF